MKNIITATSCLALLLAACGGGGDGPSTPPGAAVGTPAQADPDIEVPHTLAASDGSTSVVRVIARDVVVMLQPGVSAASVAQAYGARVLDQFGLRPIHRLRLNAGVSLEDTLARMALDSRIRFAEANAASESPEKKDQEVWAIGGDAGAYAAQWAPQALGLAAAHTLAQGRGVRVAVLDTGIDATHPALATRLARDGGGALLGRDFVGGDADPREEGSASDAGWGHGTHVAGLVALAAPAAQLMPVRVLDAAGRGNAWVLAEAILWAVDPDGDPRTDDGARVINISLGTTMPTRLLNTAIELATCSDDDDNEAEDDYSDPGFDADRERCNQRPGVVVVAAAGNGGSASERIYPAAEGAAGQLALTATREGGTLAAFSNRGAWVNLAAPGERIVSSVPGGAYATWSGSSMATPLAAGVAALVLELKPDWKPVDVSKRLLERSVALCGGAPQRGLHALGAAADFVPADPACAP